MHQSHLMLLPLLLAAACGTSSTTATDAQNAAPAIRNLSRPSPEVWCSGQPTEAQFDELAAAGVSRVIHLRASNEKGTGWEEQRAASAGVEFVRLPIAGAAGLTRSNVEAFAQLLDKPTEGRTLVSCGSSNRVGALLALKAAWLDGRSKQDAMQLGREAGMTRLAGKVEQLLSQ